MAYPKKDNPIECTRVIHDLIAKGEVKRAYLLYGEERYLVKQNKDNLMKFLNPQGDTMNVNVYTGSGINVPEVIDVAETLPFFADRRIILLEDTGLFSGAGEELAEYLPTAPESTVFVFVEQAVDGRCKLMKAVKDTGVAVNYVRQTQQTLETWVKGRLRQEHKQVPASVITHFLNKTGDNMQLIEQELEKLISYALEKEEITVHDVNAVCTTTIEDHIFDMIESVSMKDQKKTLMLYRDLLTLKEAPAKILALINGEFARLLTMKDLQGKNYNRTQMADRMGIKEFVVTKRMPILGKYTKEQLENCLCLGVETDQSFKEGRINDRLAVELLLVQLTEA